MDRISSIEFAIKNEQTEKEYYLNEANRTKNPVAKRLFETLAADEEEHKNRLQVLYEKLIADGSWPKDVSVEVAGTMDNLEMLSARLDTLTAELEAGRGTLGRLLKDEKLYQDLEDTIREARILIAEVREHPEKFFRVKVF